MAYQSYWNKNVYDFLQDRRQFYVIKHWGIIFDNQDQDRKSVPVLKSRSDNAGRDWIRFGSATQQLKINEAIKDRSTDTWLLVRFFFSFFQSLHFTIE
jgi:hypothetical protein